jgi:isoleucyl-tRNA synthetase
MELLIREELNVKEIVYMDDLSEFMNIEYRPNYRAAGQMFGKDIKEFAKYLSSISDEDIKKFNNDDLQIYIGDNGYNISKNLVEVRINSKEGYNVSVFDNKIIILNTDISVNLRDEGLARETISKIQQMRKSNGYEVANKIKIYYSSDNEYSCAIEKFLDFVKSETLAIDIIRENEIDNVIDINGYKVGIRLERVID